MNQTQYIKSAVNTADKNIEATLKLLSEDCTIPFISRYRKDTTGNLDEVQIENIAKLSKQYDEIVKRKDSILKTIDEQGNLTLELKSKIEKSFDLQEIEDLYLPFKKKKKTRADVARENGLEPLAKIIMNQNSDNVEALASQYLNENVESNDQALQGARDIIAEWINENIYIRKNLRRLFQRQAVIKTKVVKKKAEEEEAVKKKAEDEKLAKAKLDNCNRAKTSMTALKSGVRIATMNAKGEQEFFDDAKRASETKRAQEIIDESCK